MLRDLLAGRGFAPDPGPRDTNEWQEMHLEDPPTAAYSYHAHYHGIDQRWDFDPAGHPEVPYHFHPPEEPNVRQPQAGAITPEEALDAFARWIEDVTRSTSG
jgi:hypothetical protein